MTTSNIEPELNSLQTKLEVEIANDRKEIDIRSKRIKKNELLLKAVRGSLGVSNPSNKPTGYGTKSDTVRAAIRQMTKPRFTQADIESEIRRVNPDVEVNRERIRSTLWTLAKEKKELIKQVRDGTNRQPAEFEKLPTFNGNQVGFSQSNDSMRRAMGVATNSGVFTVGKLEDLVREKNRRLPDIAKHFNVDKATVLKFFEPASKVYIGEKGWIKIRE